MNERFARRTFLKLVVWSGAAASVRGLPGCGSRETGPVTGEAHFFTAKERSAVESLASAIVPEDRSVGAVGAGAVEYIDRFLAAFDNPVPTLYRGGPFSGRTPYPDPRTGEPSDRYPANDFLVILPPTRMQEAAYRILLYGSDSVPNGNINAPIVPANAGLRTIYRNGIAEVEAAAVAAGAPDLPSLDAQARLEAFDGSSHEFQEALLTHLAEGMFCAPEYGGNLEGVAWRDYLYDGDSQPLGHTLFDRETQTLYDRPDQPNQTLDPRRQNDGLEPEAEAILEALLGAVGGKRFF